jgi:sporulation protein YlmC with PRC-barrel domain
VTVPVTEVHVEQLLGKKVHDSENRVIGRLEEFHVEVVDNEHVVTEFLIGPEALLQRIGVFLFQLPILRLIPMPTREYCVPWTLMDLADPHHPRVRSRRDELPRA